MRPRPTPIPGCATLIAAALLATAPAARAQPAPAENPVVWEQGESQLAHHHVYGLCVTPRGTVLSLCEGRIKGGDTTPHHILLKRSTDGGRTWGDNITVVTSDGKQCYANPTPVVDRATGRVFLFYALNSNNQSARVFYKTSDDDGVTWSEPVEVTQLFDGDPLKRPFHLPGPGHGIQLKSGRLVVPIWHRMPLSHGPRAIPAAERQYGDSVILSDDGGKTWRSGGYAASDMTCNESRVLELADGTLLMTARRAGSPLKEPTRAISRSTDGGMTWSQPAPDAPLGRWAPVDCGFIRLTHGPLAGKNVLVFTHPDDPKGRTKQTVSLSPDGGATWPHQLLIDDGAGYSDAVELPDGTIGVLYSDWKSSKGPVRFARVDPAALMKATTR